MIRAPLLDLFCGAGGAGHGYHQAGFDVYGVDHQPQPDYPHWFHQGDALRVLDDLARGGLVEFTRNGERRYVTSFAAVHASPPCQAHSTITPDPSKHPDLIAPTRERVERLGVPYVIENVEGARGALREPVRLCGSSFGLAVRRHRLFEVSFPVAVPACDHKAQGTPVGVYGGLRSRHWARPDGRSRGRKATSVGEARDAMGMPWAGWYGLTQAVPPVYTEWIGRQLLAALDEGVAA